MERVEITGIANGGAGVGRLPDGRVTFVHRTVVGDQVEVRVTESKPRWTRSQCVAVVRSGPGRREAPCPHYDGCGGCTLQHLVYPAQLDAKAGVVADALQRIGGLDVETPPVEPSPEEVRYRNRVTFTLRRQAEGVVAGYHRLEAPDRLLDVTAACLLPEPAIASAWDALRAGWGPEARRLPSGEELRLTLRANQDGVVALLVDGGYAPGRPAELVAAVRELTSVWHRPDGASEWRLVAGTDALTDIWAGADLDVRADVFTQVNRRVAARLEAAVLERVMARAPARAVDAYSGTGLYTRRLEEAGVAVMAIESHPEAVAEARRAAPGSTVLQGTVEARLGEALPADVAILNPPRSGVDGQVTKVLMEEGPDGLVYVSCDPATLARDLRRLAPRYEVVNIECFDLFPQTAHVETVVELERCATT